MNKDQKNIVRLEYALASVALFTAALTFYKVYLTYQKSQKK